MQVHRRRRGRATTIPLTLIEVDGVDLRVDAVYASGDVVVRKDAGAEVTVATGFTDEGKTYDQPLSDAEMQCEVLTGAVVDLTATKIWLDTTFVVETFEPPGLLQATDIATLAAQDDFTLAEGSTNDDAYNGMLVVVIDATTLEQKAVGIVKDYVGSTKQVLLIRDPGIFVMAAGDYVDILAIPPGYGQGASGVVPNEAKAGTLSVTQMSTNLTEATADHYKGRTIVWVGGVLLGQSAPISAYVGTNGVLTYATTTDAPVAGDPFVIV